MGTRTITGSLTFIPNGYTGASNMSVSNATRAYYGSDHTDQYATVTASSTSQGYVYFTLDTSTVSSLPSNATITSITAKFRARLSNTSRISSAAGQLYNNTTAMGSSTSIATTTVTEFTISNTGSWTRSNLTNMRLRLTGKRASSNYSGAIYLYGATITVNYSYTVTTYDVTASVTDAGGTVSPTSGEVIAGESYTIGLTPNSAGVRPFKVLDNNVDVTSQLVESSGQASSYTVAKASGASYGFNEQSGGYWESGNTGVNNSAAVAVITLTIRNNATVTINATASSEASYDYGYLSEIGSTFSTSASAESSYKWRGSGTDYDTVNYGTLTPGTYQIYAKFYKDQYEAGNDDTFTFKVNISETVPTGGGFTYTINNVQANHTVTVQFNPSTAYNITGTVASSLSVSPSLPQSVYEGYDFDFIITPTLPGTITVVDNNSTAATYIIPLGDLSAKTYTIENVHAAHVLNIQFVELAKYNITGTIATGLSISPSLPVNNKYQGTSQTFTITPTAPGTIVVNDNGNITRYTIPRNNIHSVEYSISDIATNHTLAITFEALQQYQISGTVQSGLTVSPTLPQSVYGGDDFTLTITPSAGGKVIVNDNGQDYIYTVSRTNVQPVTHYIANIAEAHVLAITYEAPVQFTVSGTVGSGVSISPSLPQSFYTGDNFALTITPSDAGIITVVDNSKTTTYQIVAGQVAAVIYNINGITESHTLAITFEALPQYTISVGPNGIASGVTISPSLPVTKYLGESQTFTITPSTSGTITIIEDNVEKAIHYIIPGEVNPVTYSITNIAANHTLEVKYSVLPQFTATASLTGTGTLSDTSITEYAGNKLTFTVSNVPTSNILIIVQDGQNVSAKAEQSGTTYTYIFPLVNDTNITFTSKVPQNVDVDATIDQFGSVDPESTTVLEGDEYTLVITPSDYQTNPPTKPLSVSDNYVEVVDQLELKQDTASPTFTANNSSYTNLSSSNTSLWANARNKTAENPSTTSSSSNSYSSGNNTTGTITYTFDFSSIPSNANIISVSCRARGHAESSTKDSTHFCRIQLYKNGTAVGSYGQFSSTSNATINVANCGTWTRSELNNLTFVVTVGYYGGMIYGISLVIEYEVDAWRYYYTVPVYEAKEIFVKYKPDFYVKVNNQWKGRTLTSLLPKIGDLRKHVKKLYVKIGGVWKSVD